MAKTELHETHHLGCKTVWEAFEINLIKKRHKNNFIGYRKKIKKDESEKKHSRTTHEQANETAINFSPRKAPGGDCQSGYGVR